MILESTVKTLTISIFVSLNISILSSFTTYRGLKFFLDVTSFLRAFFYIRKFFRDN